MNIYTFWCFWWWSSMQKNMQNNSLSDSIPFKSKKNNWFVVFCNDRNKGFWHIPRRDPDMSKVKVCIYIPSNLQIKDNVFFGIFPLELQIKKKVLFWYHDNRNGKMSNSSWRSTLASQKMESFMKKKKICLMITK